MTKPNLIAIVRNEKRITELETLIPALVKDWLRTPQTEMKHYQLRNKIDELQLEYKERKTYYGK